MTIWAEIIDGAVWATMETDLPFSWPEFQLWIDVTNFNPVPEQGWTWDGSTFTAPVPPYIDPRPELYAELDRIDKASARPLRVLIISDPDVGMGTPERAELEALELRAAELRAQLEALPPPP